MRAHTLALATLLGLATLATTATGVAAADKHHHRYVGIHPITKAYGGGMCHIEAPHVHVYAPAAADLKVQYRDHDGYDYFVGDPVAYQWDGPKTAYYGHHPVPVHVVVGDDFEDTEYCYLEGPHYHAWAPPPDVDLDLRLEAGAYWYVGDFPKAYVEGKVTYDPIDVVYQPIVYTRPTVVVEAPPPHWYGGTVLVVAPVVEVRGPRGRVEPAHVHGGVGVIGGIEVVAPAVRVEVALPTVEFGIGAHVHAGGGYRGHDEGHWKHKRGKKRGH